MSCHVMLDVLCKRQTYDSPHLTHRVKISSFDALEAVGPADGAAPRFESDRTNITDTDQTRSEWDWDLVSSHESSYRVCG